MIGRAIFNRTPLPPNRFAPLPLGAVKPAGWLEEQLSIQARAARETLTARFPGADGSSSWLGGTRDDATSASEALAGLVGLAYVTGDEALVALVRRFVDWTLRSQTESGDFGPAGLADWWPKLMMLRVLQRHFTATADREALKCMDRFFRFQLQTLPSLPLMGHAAARAGENLQSVLFLYNLTGQPYLRKLCDLIRAQSLDWTDELHIFPHIRPTAKYRPWPALEAGLKAEGEFSGVDQKVNGREYHLTHAVDLAFGLKTPGMINLVKSGFKEVSAFKVGWSKLMKQHGVALGMYTGDDHLAGANPAQGVNLDAVCETMVSLSALIGTGDEFGWEMADVLEKLSYNALPAAWSRDGRCSQRLQQADQVDVSLSPRPFYNAPNDALCMSERPIGLSEGGFAQLASSLWYATGDDGLAAVGYAPCTVSFVAGGERVRVDVSGDYPFGGQVALRVTVKQPCEFPLYLRIPGWAEQAILTLPDGELMQMRGGEIACVRRRWIGEESLEMDLPMRPRLTRWARRSGAVELGPLLMCLNLTGDTPWNWALIEDEPMKAITGGGPARAFKQGVRDVRVLVKAARTDEWAMGGASCQQPPVEPQADGAPQVIALTPYGDSDLRIAQFPVIPPSKG
ncbi:hypothetical protein ACH6CV_12450 [Bacillota bacterium Meth-B3]